LDVCKAIIESGLAKTMDPEKAKTIEDKVSNSELTKQEQGWIRYEDLTLYPNLSWNEQD